MKNTIRVNGFVDPRQGWWVLPCFWEPVLSLYAPWSPAEAARFQNSCQGWQAAGQWGLQPVFAAQMLAPELLVEAGNFANDFNLCFSQNALYFDPWTMINRRCRMAGKNFSAQGKQCSSKRSNSLKNLPLKCVWRLQTSYFLLCVGLKYYHEASSLSSFCERRTRLSYDRDFFLKHQQHFPRLQQAGFGSLSYTYNKVDAGAMSCTYQKFLYTREGHSANSYIN